ncbi:TrkH family potassium uptake protein [Microvirga guangxiensis]|uniref:Trk system potassium uptake protein n=1 Tax=Microvirga guangxiensis TaxID=549386 RepID=A0A1G5LG67_9HYPH|nr:TrkH family potassium uptake protein [Microvirga guangxiensis]SCZ11945.1 trk system potassium uptake protein TrkH [Microvirga guangxiensis]
MRERSFPGGWAPPYIRPVFHLTGRMLLALAAAMLLPVGVDAFTGDPDWRAFLIGSGITFTCGAALTRLTQCRLSGGLTLRQAFLLTPVAWTTIALFGAIPLYISDYSQLRDHFTNAFFESMSGLTTTGATVIVGLDDAPKGILLWRALLQWLGGIGIIGVAIAILPTLGVGGMQLFRTESSDRSEKVMPRVREIAAGIVLIYAALTVACALAYWLVAMAPFEAVAHALTTVSTAGFSTSDASMAHWDNAALHWIATLFMLSGAVPFVLYLRLVQGQRDALRDSQVRFLVTLLAVLILAVAAWLILVAGHSVADALRLAAFNVVSVVTTTGYATADYTLWGNLMIGLFFGLMFVGGCTGSTSGGMKIFRFQVMVRMLQSQFLRLLYPRGVFPRVYAGRLLPDDVIGSVVVYFSLYFICYSALTVAMMAFDLDFLTSASAAVSALSNVGPGLGAVIGPSGNFAALPDASKWLLCFGMLLGRLELFTVLILLLPQFWRG